MKNRLPENIHDDISSDKFSIIDTPDDFYYVFFRRMSVLDMFDFDDTHRTIMLAIIFAGFPKLGITINRLFSEINGISEQALQNGMTELTINNFVRYLGKVDDSCEFGIDYAAIKITSFFCGMLGIVQKNGIYYALK